MAEPEDRMREREGGREGMPRELKTRPKDSLLHSLECTGDCKYVTFIGTLENDNNQLQYNDVGCRALGSNDIF